MRRYQLVLPLVAAAITVVALCALLSCHYLPAVAEAPAPSEHEFPPPPAPDTTERTSPIHLTGHRDSVSVLAFSPDGKTLASGGKDGTLAIWDTSTGKPLATCKTACARVLAVAFSPDGKMIASAGWDGRVLGEDLVQLRDVATGKELKALVGHQQQVNSVAFSPDGVTLASGGPRDAGGGGIMLGDLRIWDVRTGQELPTHRDRPIPWVVHGLAFSSDGKTLVAAVGSELMLLTPPTLKERAVLAGHHNGICSLAFAPDGNIAATAARDQTVKLWDVAAGKGLGTLYEFSRWDCQLAITSDGRLLASGEAGGAVRLWDVPGRTELAALHESGGVQAVALTADGRKMAAAVGGTIKVWDVATVVEAKRPPAERELVLGTVLKGAAFASKVETKQKTWPAIALLQGPIEVAADKAYTAKRFEFHQVVLTDQPYRWRIVRDIYWASGCTGAIRMEGELKRLPLEDLPFFDPTNPKRHEQYLAKYPQDRFEDKPDYRAHTWGADPMTRISYKYATKGIGDPSVFVPPPSPGVYFDAYPADDNHLLLFVLDRDQMRIWTGTATRSKGKISYWDMDWRDEKKEQEGFASPFKDRFTAFVRGKDYYFVTEYGDVYLARDPGDRRSARRRRSGTAAASPSTR
jgi:WD40 repeat protein